MPIGRKNYTPANTDRISIDDPLALEKLTIRLHELESTTPRNSSKISEVKKRIALLRRIDKMPHEEHFFPGGFCRTNEETNRIEFSFDCPPDPITVQTLSRQGFHGPKHSLLYQAPRTPKYLRRAQRLAEQYREPLPASLSKTQKTKLLFYVRVLLEALSAPASQGTRLEQTLSSLSALDGVSFTVRGAQTPLAVVWLSGDTQRHTNALTSLGAVWSEKKAAYYIRIPQNPKEISP